MRDAFVFVLGRFLHGSLFACAGKQKVRAAPRNTGFLVLEYKVNLYPLKALNRLPIALASAVHWRGAAGCKMHCIDSKRGIVTSRLSPLEIVTVETGGFGSVVICRDKFRIAAAE